MMSGMSIKAGGRPPPNKALELTPQHDPKIGAILKVRNC
jgi:hypothetical protein